MKRGMKAAIALIGAAIAVAVSLYIASPWMVLHSIRSAAVSGDHRTISDHVDYAALRESVRGQITQLMMASMDDPKLKDNPFAGLGAALAMSMVGPMVDAMVTPQALAQAMTTGALRPARQGGTVREATEAERRRYETAVTNSYDGLSRFIVSYQDLSEPDGKLEMVMRRRGLFDWQIVEIDLPIEQMKKRMKS